MENHPMLRSAQAVRNHDWTNFDVSVWDVGRAEPQKGVHVWTTYRPTDGDYQTVVTGDQVPADLFLFSVTYRTRDDAFAGHVRVLRDVERRLLEQAS